MIQAEWLTKKQIEHSANVLRSQYRSYLRKKYKKRSNDDVLKALNLDSDNIDIGIDAESYLIFLVTTGRLDDFDYTDQEGLSEYNLGKLEYHNNKILIYDGLKNNKGRENFTIAHEIGHLILHYPLWLSKYCAVENKCKTATFDFICNRGIIEANRHISNNTDRIEWQANYFASCLLMPSCYIKTLYANFAMVIKNCQNVNFASADSITPTGHNLMEYLAHKYKTSRNDNSIMLSDFSWHNLNSELEDFVNPSGYDLIGYVSKYCRTSRQASEIRLQELGLLNPEYLRLGDKARIVGGKLANSLKKQPAI